MNKTIFLIITVLVAVMIIIPALTVTIWKPDETESRQLSSSNDPTKPQVHVAVYLTKQNKVIKLPMEDYIRGVVAAEMPVDFELEALKAQAMAARTFIVRKLADKDFSSLPDKAKQLNAMVTDTVSDQVFISDDELKEKWGLISYTFHIKKIKQAVAETEGQVITYDGRPIEASFFSTSNGYTENSEDYWNQALPYLKSVASPWDHVAPKFEETITLPLNEVSQKLGVKLGGTNAIKVLEQTQGKRNKKVQIGNEVLTGREVREKLGLNSSHFTAKIVNNQVAITTFGLGHGVGMSQYGANGMAKEGRTAEEIVKYYYQNVEIMDYRNWVK